MQFFDNSGAVLTNGVLYSYQAGTTTQQATFTDSTGTTQNVNPLTFGTGARAAIWLTTAQFYKFVLCAQNDGPTCAAGDVLFSADNVPGGATGSGGGGGSSPFTGIFISSTASPATSGILRLASGDTVCWRNAAGSTNLCWSKDSNDLLTWSGGSFKLPEVVCPAGVPGFDILCADSTLHRLAQISNGTSEAQLVQAGVDINTSDQVTQLHFGLTANPLSATAPNSFQYYQWNGTNVVGATLTLYLTTTYTNSTTLYTNITGLSFTANANQNYKVHCDLDVQEAVTNQGINFKWTGPAAPTAVTYDLQGNNSGAAVATAFSTALNYTTSATTVLPAILTMTLLNGANAGTVQLQAASGIATDTATIIPGSCSLSQ